MAVVKMTIGKAGRSIGQFYKYLTRDSKTKTGLITALNCRLKTVVNDMENTKSLYSKQGGRQFYDLIQTFDIGENITSQKAHELGVELAKKTFGNQYECAVVTHIDKGYLHNHILVNSVSFMSGKKFSSKRNDLIKIKMINEDILKKENLLTIKELKKQNRGKVSITQAEKHMSSKDIITNKAFIINKSNECLANSKSISEYLRKMQNSNIQVALTNTSTYFKYKNTTYGQNSLGKEVALTNLLNKFEKKTTHISIIRNAIIEAKNRSNSYDEFLENLGNSKNITINIRGTKTLSITYGKRKPVRIESFGYKVFDLKAYFRNKPEYDLFNNELKNIANKNKVTTIEDILTKMNEEKIIDSISSNNNYININNKKIPLINLINEIKLNINQEDNIFIKNIYKYLNKCISLEELNINYNINSTIVGEEIVFTNNDGFYITDKEKVYNILENNEKRRMIYNALKKSTSLPMFLTLTGCEVINNAGQPIIVLSDRDITKYGPLNSYDKNVFSYSSILDKIEDNKYFLHDDKNTFRGQLRDNIFSFIKDSNNIKEFYYKINSSYRTLPQGDDLFIFNTNTKEYFNIKELTGKNNYKNILTYENLKKVVNEKVALSSSPVRSARMDHLISNLFKATAYSKNDKNKILSEEYYKNKRLKESNSKKKI